MRKLFVLTVVRALVGLAFPAFAALSYTCAGEPATIGPLQQGTQGGGATELCGRVHVTAPSALEGP